MEPSTLQIIAGIAVAALSALGLGKLGEILLRRRLSQSDKQIETHEMNHGKAIDADVTALNLISDRLKTVEARIDSVQESLSKEMAKNSRLEAENESLRKENERQSRRLHDFAEKLVHKDKEILDLRNALHATQIELEKLKTEFHAFQSPPST